MRKFRLSILCFAILLVLSCGMGFVLKNKNVVYSKTDVLQNEYPVNISIVSVLEDYILHRDYYKNYLDQENEIYKVRVLDKWMSGENVIAKIEIIESYQGTKNVGDTIKIIEEYTINNSAVGFNENSSGSYMPMLENRDYIVNIMKSEYIKNHYNFSSKNFSCYEIGDKEIFNLTSETSFDGNEKTNARIIYLEEEQNTEWLEIVFDMNNVDEIIEEYNEQEKIINSYYENLINN